MGRKPRTNSIDERINRAYKAVGQNVQINILDIRFVFDEGKKAIAEGCDDIALRERIAVVVERIRKN